MHCLKDLSLHRRGQAILKNLGKGASQWRRNIAGLLNFAALNLSNNDSVGNEADNSQPRLNRYRSSCFAVILSSLVRMALSRNARLALCNWSSIIHSKSLPSRLQAQRYILISCTVEVESVSKSLHFFPDFLMPCCPAFMGPFPLAFSAISLFAFASMGRRSVDRVCHFQSSGTHQPSAFL